MAVIRLEGLSLFGHHGATATERRAGTRLDVEVVLDIDTSRAERSDRLRDTVSYDAIESHVRRVVEEESFRLLEALAAHLAATCVTTSSPTVSAHRAHSSAVGSPLSPGPKITATSPG